MFMGMGMGGQVLYLYCTHTLLLYSYCTHILLCSYSIHSLCTLYAARGHRSHSGHVALPDGAGAPSHPAADKRCDAYSVMRIVYYTLCSLYLLTHSTCGTTDCAHCTHLLIVQVATLPSWDSPRHQVLLIDCTIHSPLTHRVTRAAESFVVAGELTQVQHVPEGTVSILYLHCTHTVLIQHLSFS
jgi:hypothetical protein